jgi:CHAT domain-containing protein
VLGSFDAGARRAPATGNDPAAVLNSLQGADYWHIASHGVWNLRRQEDSGLMLAGREPTTVADILAFQPNPAPRLVYMSACSTNMINVERDLNDFVGLNTAFQRGGAAGVLGTQWAVSDAASALLAAKFYDQHIGQRQTPAAALKAAQAWLKSATSAQCADFIETQIAAGKIDAAAAESMLGYLADLPAGSPPFAHPYFWGGYQLYGA